MVVGEVLVDPQRGNNQETGEPLQVDRAVRPASDPLEDRIELDAAAGEVSVGGLERGGERADGLLVDLGRDGDGGEVGAVMAGRLLAGVKAELRAQVADARTLATAVVGDLEQVLAERPGDTLVRVYVNLEDYVHLHGVAAACTVRKLGRGL